MNLTVIAPPITSISPSSTLLDKSTETHLSHPDKLSAPAVNVFECSASKAKPAARVYWRWDNIKARPIDWLEQKEARSDIYGKMTSVKNTLSKYIKRLRSKNLR